MQTLPTFVYLIPTLVLFGLGVVPGLISTVIFALPAPIRLTHLGISSVPKPLIEAGEAFGATPMQLLWKVELPSAASTIIAGHHPVHHAEPVDGRDRGAGRRRRTRRAGGARPELGAGRHGLRSRASPSCCSPSSWTGSAGPKSAERRDEPPRVEFNGRRHPVSRRQRRRAGGRKALREALAALDGGATRADIQSKYGVIVGVAGASLSVARGEISVLMGLSGSGKSTLLRAANGLNPVTRGPCAGPRRRIRHRCRHLRHVADAAPAARTRGHGIPAIRLAALAHRARKRGLRSGTARRKRCAAQGDRRREVGTGRA